MKAFKFICEVGRKFPGLLFLNTFFSVAVSFLGAFSLFSISPVVDMLIHPDLKGISPVTQKAMAIMYFLRAPVSLISWLIIFLTFITLTCLFEIFARNSILRTKYAVLSDIMSGTFEDFFNARWYFFSSGKHGVLLNTFMREINTVGDSFGAMAIFFANMLHFIFFLAVPFCISWQVTLISFSAAVVFAIPFLLMGRLSYRLGKLNTKTANYLMSVLYENLNLAKIVLGYGNQDKAWMGLAGAFNEHRKATLKSQTLDRVIAILYRPFGVLVVIVALIASRRLHVPLSEITVLLLALMEVGISVGNLTTQKNSLDSFFPSYEQITSLRKRARDMRQASGTKIFSSFSDRIRLDNVSFTYPGLEPVLMDITMDIQKGKMVAVVGESGAGKSTIIDIIMGFHQPTKGKVIIDKTNLEEFDVVSFRKRIGYVPQESVLFDTSVADNLLWSYDKASQRDIESACRLANADEFINSMPEKYNTVVGNRGVRLSGGQVQRVALARAILRKPELLILDEATSNLDTNSERLIQQAIENIARQTTVIVIAHRLSTIKNADYIYLLKNGQIAEQGAYADLAQKKGHFNRMIELQLLESAE